jgi:hypothetical protein
MIPSEIDEQTLSAAERRIFNLLKVDPDTREWTALHSLGLARRLNGPFGEIDFVILVPGHGIICLEVKGGRISCRDGIWRSQNRYGVASVLKKSPFMQARDGMFALKEAIRQKFGGESSEGNCPIGFAVAFPDIACVPENPEFDRRDVIDTEDLRTPISGLIMRVIAHQFPAFARSNARFPAPPQTLARIKSFLRPDFDLVIARFTQIQRTEEKIIRLTDEQFSRLDELDENPRCFFEGAAGTGKTMLALEFSQRMARHGHRTLLLCFNRILGQWFVEQVNQPNDTTLLVGSFHAVLNERILASSFASDFKEESGQNNLETLFGKTMPFYGELAVDELKDQFDVVVLDEAQDLCIEAYLDVVDRWLVGGLAGGRWALFGDFTRQALFGIPGRGPETVSRRCKHFTRAKLFQNCRNTRRIASETAFLSGFDKLPYAAMQAEGPPVEYHYWKNRKHQRDLIEKIVEGLLGGGVLPEDIVLLGPKKQENSALAGVAHIGETALVDVTRGRAFRQSGSISYSTIHAFKGMESAVILILDIDDVDADEPQAALYVGMSRARSNLIMLISEKAAPAVQRRLRLTMLRDMTT